MGFPYSLVSKESACNAGGRWARRQQGARLPPPQLNSPPSRHRAPQATAPPSPCPSGASEHVQTLTSNLSPGQHSIPPPHNQEESFQAIY